MNWANSWFPLFIWFLTGASIIHITMSDQVDESERCDGDECSRCSTSSSLVRTRPFLRTALARSIYSKMQQDEEFEDFDRSKVRAGVILFFALVTELPARLWASWWSPPFTPAINILKS